MSTERQFLHDLATPLSMAMIFVGMVADSLDERGTDCLREAADLKQASQAMDRLKTMLDERRETLKHAEAL